MSNNCRNLFFRYATLLPMWTSCTDVGRVSNAIVEGYFKIIKGRLDSKHTELGQMPVKAKRLLEETHSYIDVKLIEFNLQIQKIRLTGRKIVKRKRNQQIPSTSVLDATSSTNTISLIAHTASKTATSLNTTVLCATSPLSTIRTPQTATSVNTPVLSEISSSSTTRTSESSIPSIFASTPIPSISATSTSSPTTSLAPKLAKSPEIGDRQVEETWGGRPRKNTRSYFRSLSKMSQSAEGKIKKKKKSNVPLAAITKVVVGDYVMIADSNGEHIAGLVLKSKKNKVYISCMSKYGVSVSNYWKWATNPKKVWLDLRNVLQKIEQLTSSRRRGIYYFKNKK